MARTMRTLGLLTITALTAGLLAGCSSDEPDPEPTPGASGPVVEVPTGPTDDPTAEPSPSETPDTTPDDTPTTPAEPPTQPGGITDLDDVDLSDWLDENPDDSTVEVDGVTCGQREGTVRGLCWVDKPGWPSREEMLTAGVVAQRFVDAIWTFDALADSGATGPDEALADAIDRFGTPELSASLADVVSGQSWDAFSNLGTRMTTTGVGRLDAVPVTEQPFSETEFTVTVNYSVRIWSGQRHSNHWMGGPQNIYLTLASTGDGWRVTSADAIDMPATLIEWNGPRV